MQHLDHVEEFAFRADNLDLGHWDEHPDLPPHPNAPGPTA
jgi:hypothetical protein